MNEFFEDETDSYLSKFYVDLIHKTKFDKLQAYVNTMVGPYETPIKFKIDPDSQVNIITEKLFKTLRSVVKLKIPLRGLP